MPKLSKQMREIQSAGEASNKKRAKKNGKGISPAMYANFFGKLKAGEIKGYKYSKAMDKGAPSKKRK